MMAKTGWLMLGASLALGATATLLAATWMSGRAPDSGATVVVAGRDIPAGQLLDSSLFQTVLWPRASLPSGTLSDPAVLSGRVSRTALVRGEPVLTGKLAPEGTRGGLAAVISPGHRAITVRVNEVVGVAGFALPGNYVDVLVSAQDESERTQMVSRIVLERILVLAVAQESARDETRPKVVSAVTLEVTPQQAERLDLARNIGQLSLALRNQVDSTPIAGRGVSRAELLGASGRSEPPSGSREQRAPSPSRAPVTQPAAIPASVPTQQVEVIRGVLKSSAAFSVGDEPHGR